MRPGYGAGVVLTPWSRAAAAAVALCTLLPLAACSQDAPSGPPARTSDPGGTPSPESSAGPDQGPITLAFAGDINLEGRLADGRIGGLRRDLAAADLSVVNLETAVTGRGVAADKQYVFRGPASALAGLKDAGIDVVSVANNHGMDYGQTGLRDTLDAASAAGLPLIGAGLDEAAAFAPYRTTRKGQRLSVLAATQVLDEQFKVTWAAGPHTPGLASAYHVETLLAAVREARATSDVVVVFLHWGVELQTCPAERATTLAQQLSDAGADVVVGSHAHVLLGDGRLGNTYVDYGLGNFQFYNGSGPSAQTGVLTLTMQGRQTMKADWDPGVMRSGRPEPLTGAAREAALAQREQRRACTGLTAP